MSRSGLSLVRPWQPAGRNPLGHGRLAKVAVDIVPGRPQRDVVHAGVPLGGRQRQLRPLFQRVIGPWQPAGRHVPWHGRLAKVARDIAPGDLHVDVVQPGVPLCRL